MVGIVALIIMAFFTISKAPPQETQHGAITQNVQIGDTVIPVELAKTPTEQEKGLSYRTSLDKNKGMLFVFQKPDTYRFWMPNMDFPIDIIWVDETKHIISINENVPPLEEISKPIYYQPTEPALYVLEVNANFSKEHTIKTGDQLTFQNITN